MVSYSKKPLKILFLTFVPFPYGLAQTNRLIAIARGLISAGGKVTVICLKPTEKTKSKNNTHKGVYDGIEYAYPGGTTVRSKNPLRRACQFISGLFNTSLFLIKENRRIKIDFIIIGVVPFFMYTWFYILCKLLKIKYLQERSEYPFIKAKESFFDPISLKIYLKLACKYFDGFMVITHELKSYFKPYLRKDCPVFILPILVESERFTIESIPSGLKYIAYCGSMQGNKDGIPDLIEAFSLINNDYPDVKLYLIGSTQFPEFDDYRTRISDLSLQNRIIFTGTVDRDELPALMANAMMLVLARPETIQAKGGFPTKLGEYLATGKPVLVTDVGEITRYLKDGVHAYISPPGKPADFAKKMKYIIDNYAQALAVALQGQHLAQTVFNYKYQGQMLYNWMKDRIDG